MRIMWLPVSTMYSRFFLNMDVLVWTSPWCRTFVRNESPALSQSIEGALVEVVLRGSSLSSVDRVDRSELKREVDLRPPSRVVGVGRREETEPSSSVSRKTVGSVPLNHDGVLLFLRVPVELFSLSLFAISVKVDIVSEVRLNTLRRLDFEAPSPESDMVVDCPDSPGATAVQG